VPIDRELNKYLSDSYILYEGLLRNYVGIYKTPFTTEFQQELVLSMCRTYIPKIVEKVIVVTSNYSRGENYITIEYHRKIERQLYTISTIQIYF